MRRHVVVVALVAVLGFLGCGSDPKNDDDIAAHVGGLMPGDPNAVGENFNAEEEDEATKAARLQREQQARQARKDQLKKTLPNDGADASWQQAQREEKQQNWKQAEDHYRALAVHAPSDKRAPAATEKAMHLAFRRGEYGEGLRFYEDVFLDVEAPLLRAKYARLLAQTMLSIPHYGTTRGGEYLRERFDQGTPTQTYAEDRRRAVQLLEEAASLLERVSPKDAALKTLQNAVDLELVGALSRFTPLDASFGYWWSPWTSGGVDDGTEDDEGADAHADEGYGRGRHGWDAALSRAKPRGIPVDENGEPIFSTKPSSYAAATDDIGRIKFLVARVQDRDDGDKQDAARALLLQAMLFHTRDGSERLERLRHWWWGGSAPYQADVERFSRLTSLADDEVVTLVGTHIGVVKLPADEQVPQLLQQVVQRYPHTKAADDALYLRGQFHQSRLQYDAALKDYDDYLRAYAQGAHRGDVESAKAALHQPLIEVVEHGPSAAGRPARLQLKHRNVAEIQVSATRLDVQKAMRQFEAAWAEGRGRNNNGEDDDGPSALLWRYHNSPDQILARFGTDDKKTFRRSVHPATGLQTAEETIDTEMTTPGLWAVDVADGRTGAVLARTLLGVERLAVVSKQTQQGTVAWVVDAATGSPVANAEVHVFAYWNDWLKDKEVRHSQKTKKLTNTDGTTIVDPADHQTMIWAQKDGVASFPVGFWSNRYAGHSGWGNENEHVAVMMTDRTVYRPGDTVNIKVWARNKVQGKYRPAAEVKNFQVRVSDARGAQVLEHRAAAEVWGSTSLTVPLKATAPLGAYHVQVIVDGNHVDTANSSFRVEAYKAPEFEVLVKSAAEARLGESVKVTLSGQYLSGGGVADGQVHYKVYRQDHTAQWSAPGPWDWLYGRGYGRVFYDYHWFSWWHGCVPAPMLWYPWWGPAPEAPRELVKEGGGVLNAQGELLIDVDTARAKAEHNDKDHKYTVVAEVVDPSRRLVRGEGEVIVTRTAFLAVLEAQNNFSDPGKDLVFVATTLRPDGTPIAVDGKLVVEAVSGLGEDPTSPNPPAPLVVKLVEEKPLKTDTNGPVRVTWRAAKTGQYRVSFVAKDSAGQDVRSSQIVWAYGPDFQGALVRTADLEILADKRSYAVGDTARLLVHTNSNNAAVLFATRVNDGALLEWKVIRTREKSAIVSIPITAAHMPNFFVEATTVNSARLVQEARELFVPPTDSELKVEVKVDRAEHKPGDTATVTIKTTDKNGAPVAADVAVSVFDAATLQIAPDAMPDVRAHFWGRKRTHMPQAQTSLTLHFAGDNSIYEPFQQAASGLTNFAQRFFQSGVDYRRGGDAQNQLTASFADSAAPAEAVAPSAAAPPRGRASAKMARAEVSGASNEEADSGAVGGAGAGGGALERGTPRVVVRSQFADTAHWAPSVVTDKKTGLATVTLKFPDNTTTWKVKAVGMDAAARAGRGDEKMVTTKKLLVRLAAPRFFRERDEVTLSAIVQNRYGEAKTVDVGLLLKNADGKNTAALLTPRGASQRRVTVKAFGEERIDFVVAVTGEGQATVRVSAIAGDDGDAKELTFPVLVHGMEKMVAVVGSIPMGQGTAERSFEVEVPKARREAATVLTIRTSPSLAGAMVDALPYLLDYPFDGTEQTLSRFVPAVITRRALQQAGGVKLEDLAATRTNLNAQQLTAGGQVDKDRLARELRRHPIYNTDVMSRIIEEGLHRIAEMQHGDGGWGWWKDDDSSTYMTALTLNALLDARDADLPIDEGMLQRGQQALRQLVEAELWRFREHKDWVSDSDAFAALVLARRGDKVDEVQNMLFERRIQLSAYGKLLFARALLKLKENDKAQLLLQNAEQNLKEDRENETAWIETRSDGWWYWYNDDIETNAAYLMALHELRPGDKRAPLVVKWLLNHRQHGYYWDSTRDTSNAITALAKHMAASGEQRTNYDLQILVDGEVKKQVHIDGKNIYSQSGDLTLEGAAIAAGKHTITIRRTGEGAVYFNGYLSYFTLEDNIEAAGLELKIDRAYFKLERQDRTHTVAGDRGQGVASTEVRYKKVPLASGDTLVSGDVVLVELLVNAKNNYTDIALVDPKPAGAEAVALRSGTVVGEGVSHMELRDDNVTFFLPAITQGKLKLSYRLRAEVPGRFSAMPTQAFLVYAPEIKANSNEWKVKIDDAP